MRRDWRNAQQVRFDFGGTPFLGVDWKTDTEASQDWESEGGVS
jgi:hypothetical protein